MGRPRKRRRAEDEVRLDGNSDIPGLLDDGTSTSIQASSLEDFLAATPTETFGLDGLNEEPLSWDPSQLTPGAMFDFADWNVAEHQGQYFNEDGVVPLHLPIPMDSLQTRFPDLPMPGCEATTVIQDMSANLTPSKGPGCACLTNLYLTLSSFQSLPPPSFPLSSGNLQKATNTARDVLRCPCCPKTFNSAFQNISLLGTLLPLIIMEYAKLLSHVDEKSAGGESVTFRMGIQDPALMHHHTGTVDCPMGFNIELSAVEWRRTARKVIKQQVHGVKTGNESLCSLIDELEQRQHTWHSTPYPQSVAGYTPVCTTDDDKGERGCIRVVKNLRKSILALDLLDDEF